MKHQRTIAKKSLNARTLYRTSHSRKFQLINSINQLDYDELLFVSQAGNEYFKGMKPRTLGSKKLDSIAKCIGTVSVHNRPKARKILEDIDKKIVRKNKVSVKITAEATQKLLELMRK